jgi:energy-coupling factor transport system ATP-binding protein
VLEAISVGFAYPGSPGLPALAGVDFSVGPGEWVALVGANGSGKSTLLKILAGILVPSEGSVRFDGADLRGLEPRSEIARRVGIVFQDPETQLVSPTVERELAFGMEQLGFPVEDMRTNVIEVMQRFAITHLKSRPPQSLSGGEKQRVTLASVLAMRPSVLLLDEPTALLDAAARRTLISILDGLRGGSTAIVLVTASPEEALRADRVVVLSEGVRVADERPGVLYADGGRCERWGLARPPAACLAESLGERGIRLPPGIMNVSEFVDAWDAYAGPAGRGDLGP